MDGKMCGTGKDAREGAARFRDGRVKVGPRLFGTCTKALTLVEQLTDNKLN
jgi:hypothetical protein